MLNAETKPKFLYLPYTKQRKIFTEKILFKEKGSGGLNKNEKKALTALATVIKKDLTRSIRKHANKLKVHEKPVRIRIKQILSPDHNLHDYAIWGVLENKTYAKPTSHPDIGSLKTANEEKWNKMSQEFILKRCKSFRRRIGTIIEKMTAILSKFTVLSPSSYFVVYFLKFKLIFFFIESFIIILEHS